MDSAQTHTRALFCSCAASIPLDEGWGDLSMERDEVHALTRQLYTLRMRVWPLAKSAATARVMAASGMSLQSWSTPCSSLRGGPVCHKHALC